MSVFDSILVNDVAPEKEAFRNYFNHGEIANVKQHGAVGDGVTNDSVAVQAAFDTGRIVYFPAGTYLFNIIATNPFIMNGDGSEVVTIKPFSYAAAAITYRAAGVWSYHTIIRGVTFEGAGSSMTAASTLAQWRALSSNNGAGIGLAVGASDPATFVSGYELMGWITFQNVRFKYLYKGSQMASGNLGISYENCNFSSNYYGAYWAQGKGIPPGQKFVTGGESNSNRCSFYVDVQQAALGQITFRDHVFEANSINVRVKQPAGNQLNNPIKFVNCWNESNGTLTAGHPSTVTLDQWTGTGAGASVADQTGITCSYPFIFDVDYVVFDGGFVSGISLLGLNQVVTVRDARVEQTSAYLASPFNITSRTSQILFEGCNTISGLGNLFEGCREIGPNFNTSQNDEGANATGRGHNLEHPLVKSAGAVASGLSLLFDRAGTNNYSGTPAGVVTAAGVPGYFRVANRYNFTGITGAASGTFSGSTYAATINNYIVATFTVNVAAAGALSFAVWDAVDQYVFTKQPPVDSTWHTYGGIAKMTASCNLIFGITTADAGATGMDFYVGPLQIREFSTYEQAQKFLYSQVYAYDESWAAVPALQNSWVDFGAGEEAEYTRDLSGMVHIRGRVKNGSAVGTLITTLPLGFRPSKIMSFASASNGAYGEFTVGTNGAVTGVAGSTTAFSLAAASFMAA